MNSFFNILQKYIHGGDLAEFWNHIFGKNAIIVYYYFYIKKCAAIISDQSDLVIHFKFREYRRILDNMFLQHNGSPELIQDLFCKAQKTYRAFSKLARMFRIKRAPLQVDHDMYMNPIDLKNRNTMIIFQNGAKYAFKLSDLINILNRALAHSPNFFADPLFPKNPYTNVEFETGALYEMYDRIKKSDYKMPVLIHAFYCAEFDVDKFAYDNEAVIRDISISDYVKTSTNDTLVTEIKCLFRIYDKKKLIQIDKDFPGDRLVQIMRPYLYLHFFNQYSLYETSKRNDIFTDLHNKLRRFIAFNPRFGKKCMKRRVNDPSKFYSDFFCEHPKFDDPVDSMDISESEESDS